MTTLFSLLFTALTANLIFTHALGMSTIAVSAKSKTDFIGIGVTITLFTTIGSALTWLINPLLHETSRLRPLVYIALLAVLYVVTLVVLYAAGKAVFKRFRKYIHLSVFNCAVLGTLLLTDRAGTSFLNNIGTGFIAGLGFLMASCILKAVYPALTSERVPTSVRGYPAILLYIGILAMAMYGLHG